ncbi:MAG TPA: penicillin-binding protein 2 [Nevskiaceae bacterium]|nr:penicillin-binding protein 2 [Nevskiaceae bacterium]
MSRARSTSEAPAQAVRPWRRQTVLAVLALGAVVVAGRAFQLQVLEKDFLAREGAKRHVRTLTLSAHRGAIRDRRGEALALSAPVDSIWCVPADLLASPPHVEALAQMMEIKPRQLTRFLEERKGRDFVYLQRQLSPEEAKRLIAIKAPGVHREREYRRYYPAGEVAGQVVGFTDLDGRGVEGMEAARDPALSGKPGRRQVIRDAKGRTVENSAETLPAEAGRDLALTLDLRLQYLAYRELKNAVQRHQAKGGLVVIADAKSGEVLAMASQPGYNPNNPDDRGSRGARNRAIIDSFEPGSTVKPLVLAQALELGRIAPDTVIDTGPGWWQVGRLTVRDVHPHGLMDLSLILSKSSNVGAAKIGLDIGAESIWSGFQKFGLGERIGSGFPGEVSPLLRPPQGWGQIETATASYGYGLSVNALHLVRAYAALANDGLMPQLSLTLDEARPPPQRAISARTARDVRALMEGVITRGGTGTRAAIPGYRVAGKTGTVRKVAETGGYASNRHQSVFIGMAPAENPRLVGLVMIDEPGSGGYYGGVVAAPVFSTVVQGALRLLHIAPDPSLPPPPAAEPPLETVAVPLPAEAAAFLASEPPT